MPEPTASFVRPIRPTRPHRLLDHRWPLPALLAWAAAWGALFVMRASNVPTPLALALAAALPLGLAGWATGRWRRSFVAAGFPLSALVLGAGGPVPAWAWLLPLGLLLLIYPMQAWHDAPVFPTDREALAGLETAVRLPRAPRILDAGSGLGHGLQALHAVWPGAQLTGLERSAPLAVLSRLRCPYAAVHQGDMWAGSWAGYDLVYLFQRPESMQRAWDKACAEMAPQGWLVSLEFEVPGVAPAAVLRRPGQRPVHVYRLVAPDRSVPAQPRALLADKSPRTAHARAAG